MALKLGPVNGHTIMLDAQSDPNCIWIMCSCGEVLNVDGPPSGESLRVSMEKMTEHMGMELDDEKRKQIAEGVALFDEIFPQTRRE